MMFMQPQITVLERWWFGPNGSPVLCGADFSHREAAIEAEGPVNMLVGYGARLSAPGYLDCTDWTVHPSVAQAIESLRDSFCSCDSEEPCEICAALAALQEV